MNDDYYQFWLKSGYSLDAYYEMNFVSSVQVVEKRRRNLDFRRFVAKVIGIRDRVVAEKVDDVSSVWDVELYSSQVRFEVPLNAMLVNRKMPGEIDIPGGTRNLVCSMDALSAEEVRKITRYQGLFLSKGRFRK